MTPEEQTTYEAFMRTCIELALVAKKQGDTPAGAVIVHQGKIIAEGIEANRTKNDITFHAEIIAVRNAVQTLHSTDLSQTVLVTTHEPCIMCSYVIRHYKISTVVFGVSTGEIGGCSSPFPLLTEKRISRWNPPPKILSGILEDECRELH